MTEPKEKTHVCPVCGRAFEMHGQLVAHSPSLCRYIHKCPKCERDLERRMEGAKPVKVCPHCGFKRDMQ
jgi:DNA-directed RNA polymerase subunit RPC12/RpoP